MLDYHYSTAHDCYLRGQYSRAIELLKQLLAEDPNVAKYHGLLAGCLLNTKRLHAAEYELHLALQLDPEDAFLFLIKANISLFNNKRKEALAACEEALSFSPSNVDALLLKSDIYLIFEQRKEALECIEEASSHAPESTDVLQSYGNFYYTINDLKQAEEYVRSALAIDAQHESSNVLMGKILLRKGEVVEAEYHAKFVIHMNPDSESALKLFCDIKMRKSIVLGMWWKFNAWIANMSNIKSSMVLISGYFIFMLSAQILADFNFSVLSRITSYAWVGLVMYSWLGIPIYYKKLKKELAQFTFNPNF